MGVLDKSTLKLRLQKIKFFALDFDGILTDGYVFVDENGKETIRCSRRDSWGIRMLKNAGIKVAVISVEANSVVKARCAKLGIACHQPPKPTDGAKIVRFKLAALTHLAAEEGLAPEQIAYMGDDLIDVDPLKYAGIAIGVKDAHPLVKKVCHYITRAKGGEHAVREACELILGAQGKLHF